jgi:hypothetical protein
MVLSAASKLISLKDGEDPWMFDGASVALDSSCTTLSLSVLASGGSNTLPVWLWFGYLRYSTSDEMGSIKSCNASPMTMIVTRIG